LVYADPAFARDGTGKLTVTTAADGVDTLTGVEVVQQMSPTVQKFLLVDNASGGLTLDQAITAAGTGDVVVTGGSLTITVAQANAMLTKGASFHTGDTVTIVDTAASIYGDAGTLFTANGSVASALN